MTYYNQTQTFEFTAFTEADLLQGTNGSSIGLCDSFTMPASATACFSVTDDDSSLSGDRYCNEHGDDWSYQTADITVNGAPVFDDVKIYAEQYHVLHGSDGKTYYMIEIELKNGDAPGEGDDFFTFYGDVPPAGTELHVTGTCNVTYNWVDYRCLSAGLKWELDEECKYTLEAEDMELWGYKAEHNDAASGDELIRLKNHTGVAKAGFGGESGKYNISIDYVDENDGEGFIDVFINGVFVGCIALNENGDGNGVSHTTFSTFTIEDVELNEGDEIKLKGRKDGWEFARIDKITFEQVKDEPGALSGRYFCDENRDDVDNGEPGVAGILVELLDTAGNAVLDADGQAITTTTDADGNYRFDNLAAGDYTVRFAADPTGKTFVAQDDPDGNGDDTNDSDVDPTTGTTGIVTVVAGEETTDVDAGVEDPGTAEISGRYFCDENDNDVDDGEPGIVGAVVELLDANGNPVLDADGQPITTTTDSNGNYAFTGLLAGTYTVRFAPDVDGKTFVAQDDPNGNGDDTNDSDVDPTTGVTGPIVLEIGDVSEDNDAGVEQLDPGTAALGDTIWLDFFGNGLLDAFEARIDGVTVQLKDENGVVLEEQVTANGGQYLFDNLNAGTYSVGIVKPALGDTVTFVNADGTTEVVTLSENGIAGFELTTPNAGDDTLDSDFDPVLMMTENVSLGAGEVNLTLDGGLLRCGLIEGSSQNVGQGNPIFPAGGYDLLVGCDDADVIRGRSGEDTLIGNGGDDELRGESFDDILFGGAGNDEVRGGDDNDILDGGADDDDIRGEEGFDIAVFSGNRADATINVVDFFTGELQVISADGTDRVRTVEVLRFDDQDVLVDEIVPGGTADAVAAPVPGGSVNIDVLANDIGVGEGTLVVAEANNGAFGSVAIEVDGTVTYTAGADFDGYDFFSYTVSNGLGFIKTVEVQVGALPELAASDPNVTALADFIGEDGDVFTGSSGSDSVLGGIGFDTIATVNGDDVVDGGKGEDSITGGGGDDLLIGGDGGDRIQADQGDDHVFGQVGDDFLFGAQTDDVMFGGIGDDIVRGQDGSDFMVGGAGDDEFSLFRTGADVALGGAGDDRFVWIEALDGAEGDVIDGESGEDELRITLDAGTDAVAVQLEVDAYFAQVAAQTPTGGTIADDSVLSGTFTFTTIDLEIRNIEEITLL